MAPRIVEDVWGRISWFYHNKIHFLQLHYFYILLMTFIASACFYFQPGTTWRYIDALFMATTAVTNTGLNVINMSNLTTWQLLVVYFSSFLCSHVMVSVIIVYVRRHYFSKRFEDVLLFNKARRIKEANRRKFEKNLHELEKRRRKSAMHDGKLTRRHPTKRRLSFLSVKSTPALVPDEEASIPSAPIHLHKKKGRFSKQRPLSTAFSHFDLMSHLRRKNNDSMIKPPSENEEPLQQLKYTSDLHSLANDNHEQLVTEPDSYINSVSLPKDDNDNDEVCSSNSTLRDDTHERISPARLNSSSLITPTLNSVDLALTAAQDSQYDSSQSQSSSQPFTQSSTAETNLSAFSNPTLSNINRRENSTNSNHLNIRFAIDENAPRHPSDTSHIGGSFANNTSTSDENDGSSHNHHVSSGTQGIAFAEDIERQREIARRRLEQDRRFEDILQRIAGDNDSTNIAHGNSFNSIEQGILLDAETEDEEMKRIMREPIHKSELTREQRYRLGGAEYRAIDFLTLLVPAYYISFIVGFGFLFRIYVAASSYAQQALRTTNENGPVDPWLFSFYTSLSAFNNLGLIPVDAGMIPFQSAPCALILAMVLILAGNTAYAIFLRLIIWILYKATPKTYVMRRETFRYLLDHPRRCYTTLFPATQTKWLLLVLIAITAVEFITFIALNYWLPVLKNLDWGARILDGLFQSVATRSAGFAVVDLMSMNPGTQIVFIVAMYISVYPVAISMRNSNVYQERALGIYSNEEEDNGGGGGDYEDASTPFVHRLKRQATISSIMTTSKKVLRKPDFFVITQIQRQLTSDICWVICSIFAICVIESEAILSISPITISTVMYECVSAFGNVGASTGYPNTAASQAAQYHTLSKLVLIILMYRGRHRGLPAAIDRAVLLPSEQLQQKEREDHMLRRRNTSFSVNEGHEDGPVLFYNRTRTL